jgi:hypothetical protein
MKIRAKLADQNYTSYERKCLFAVETMRSVNAPAMEQIVELELALGDEFLRSPVKRASIRK